MDLLNNSKSARSRSNRSNRSNLNNSIKSSLKTLNKSLKSPIKSSVKLSLNTLDNVKSGINNFDIRNIYKNNTQTLLSVVLFITIIVSYISKQYYIHLGLLFVLSIITYLITKNLFYALLVSVILSNLIMLFNIDFSNIVVNNHNIEDEKE